MQDTMKTLILLFAAALALHTVLAAGQQERVMSIEITVSPEKASLDAVSVFLGTPNEPRQSGRYSVSIVDGQGNELWKTAINPSFYIHDADIQLDSASHTEKAPYFESASAVRIYREDKMLLEAPLNLCNADGTCSGNENTLSCEADCGPDKPDSYCVKERDDVCDPDCLSGIDPDCSPDSEDGKTPKPETGSGFPYYLIPLFIILLAALALLLKRRAGGKEDEYGSV